MRSNTDIRALIAESGLYHKQVAELIGISANAFSRELSRALSAKNKQRIITAISNYEKESEHEHRKSE